MHVEDIIKNYNPMYPTNGTWQDTFKALRESPIEFNIVLELVAYLEKDGQFREPIVLSTPEEYYQEWADYEFDEGEELDPYTPLVKNGTHRVFAHYLSEHKDAKVQHGWYPDGKPTETENFYPLIASRIAVPQNLEEESTDDLFDKCRSFKLTEEVWINSDMMSRNGDMFNFYWDCGLENAEDLSVYVPLIHEKVTEIVKAVGFIPLIDTVVLHSEEEEDAFFYPERQPSSVTFS